MSQPVSIKGWTDIKQEDAPHFQSYLGQVSALESVRQYKQKTFDALAVAPGQHILDVGCGNGDDVRMLARLVGATGLVVGLDSNEALIEGARQNDDNDGLAVQFVVGDGNALDFADAAFDAVRADRVFQHVHDPERVLSEMVRVTRSDGWVVVADPDWGTLIVDHPGDRTLTRKILNYICDHFATDGWAARQSYRRFKTIGLHDVSFDIGTTALTDFDVFAPLMHLSSATQEMVQTGELTADEAAAWLDVLREADRQGHFIGSLSGFLVRGRKP